MIVSLCVPVTRSSKVQHTHTGKPKVIYTVKQYFYAIIILKRQQDFCYIMVLHTSNDVSNEITVPQMCIYSLELQGNIFRVGFP